VSKGNKLTVQWEIKFVLELTSNLGFSKKAQMACSVGYDQKQGSTNLEIFGGKNGSIS
jgi:hypothetical protein